MDMTNEYLLKNVIIRLDENNIKKGDFEKEIGVSLGYFSRIEKTPKVLPNIETLIKISEALNIGLDTLLKIDLTGISKDDRMVLNFINRLKDDTINGRLEWKCVPTILDSANVQVCDSEKIYDKKIYTNGSPYETLLKNDKCVLLRPLVEKKKYGSFLEIDVDNNFVCTSYQGHPEIKNAINELYIHIIKMEQKPKISQNVKNIINDYLNFTDK